jgi:hypothetical protein
VESLHIQGYDKVGQWDLAQVCRHLADWLRFPMEGYPVSPAPIRLMLRVVRNTVGPLQLRKLLATRSLPTGGPTLRETVPAPGGDEAAAVERLRQVISRFQKQDGELYPSPLFGELDRETWRQVQLIHCAHHLSFLLPRSSTS